MSTFMREMASTANMTIARTLVNTVTGLSIAHRISHISVSPERL
jgi:hypothetical protein